MVVDRQGWRFSGQQGQWGHGCVGPCQEYFNLDSGGHWKPVWLHVLRFYMASRFGTCYSITSNQYVSM